MAVATRVDASADVDDRAVIGAGTRRDHDAWQAVPVVVREDRARAGCAARRIGWLGRAALPLTQTPDGRFTCPRTHDTYTEQDDLLIEETR